jgi:hypothetical protein
MMSSFRPVILMTFCVVTTLPRTLAMNMAAPLRRDAAVGPRRRGAATAAPHR